MDFGARGQTTIFEFLHRFWRWNMAVKGSEKGGRRKRGKKEAKENKRGQRRVKRVLRTSFRNFRTRSTCPFLNVFR